MNNGTGTHPNGLGFIVAIVNRVGQSFSRGFRFILSPFRGRGAGVDSAMQICLASLVCVLCNLRQSELVLIVQWGTAERAPAPIGNTPPFLQGRAVTLQLVV